MPAAKNMKLCETEQTQHIIILYTKNIVCLIMYCDFIYLFNQFNE